MKEWLKCAGIRAIKTVCQTAIATIGTTTMFNEVDWRVVASASLLAGILSLLTSLAGLPELDNARKEEQEIEIEFENEPEVNYEVEEE